MKITQWLLKIVLTVVLISGLTILTTGAIVNSYVQSLLSSFNITLEGQSFSLGSMMKGMFGFKSDTSTGTSKVSETKDSTPLPEQHDSAKSTENGTNGSFTVNNSDSSDSGASHTEEVKPEEGSSTKDSGTEGSTKDSSTGGNTGADESTKDGVAPDQSIPIMGQGGMNESSAGSQSTQEDKIAASPDDISSKKQELTSSQKEQIFNILMTKLPPSEMQKISSAMEDGLTDDKLKTIEESIVKYLSPEEYNVLKSMLEK